MNKVGTPPRGGNAPPDRTPAPARHPGAGGARVRVWPGASRVQFIGPPGDVAAASRRCHIPSRGGGPRGSIVGFSDGSRRRLKRELDQLARDAVPAAVTLTTGDGGDGPTDPAEVEAMRVGYFAAVAERPEFAGVGALWLRQWERRLGGPCAGLYAPHLHAVVYQAGGWSYGSLRAFSELTAGAWADVGGGRVEIELARNPAAARLYLVERGKVTTPEERTALHVAFPGGTGRAWGAFRREQLPSVAPVERAVDAETLEALRAEAIGEANVTYQALGSGRRYAEHPQNRTATVSVGCPERYLVPATAETARPPRRPTATPPRRRSRQRAENRPPCLHSVSTRDGAGLGAKRKRLRIGVSAPPEPLSGRGAKRIRTAGLCSAIAALYQLSYSPRPSG